VQAPGGQGERMGRDEFMGTDHSQPWRGLPTGAVRRTVLATP